jgi:hypothetical protein
VSDAVLVLTARVLVTLVFGAAALHKLRRPRAFLFVLRDYAVLPAAALPAAVPLLIGAEAFAAGGLWWPTLRVYAAAGGAGLLAAYAAAIAWNLLRGRREIDCGCAFGGLPQPLSPGLVLRNTLLLVPCALASLAPTAPAQPLAAWGLSLTGAAALCAVYHAWGTLLANRPRLRLLEDLR